MVAELPYSLKGDEPRILVDLTTDVDKACLESAQISEGGLLLVVLSLVDKRLYIVIVALSARCDGFPELEVRHRALA